MNIINNYFNPFSNQFKESTKGFENLSQVNKTVAVIAAIFGAIISPFILFTGSFALFQLCVKWLNDGDNGTADSVNNVIKQQESSSNDNVSDSDSDSSISDDIQAGYDLDNSSHAMKQDVIKTYSGSIRNGTGFALVTYTDESTYIGDLKNWKRHGNGTLSRKKYKYSNCSSGEPSSTWINNELSYGSIVGYGCEYRGEIKNWQAHGHGKLIDSKGHVSNGTFENGNFIDGVKTVVTDDDTQ